MEGFSAFWPIVTYMEYNVPIICQVNMSSIEDLDSPWVNIFLMVDTCFYINYTKRFNSKKNEIINNKYNYLVKKVVKIQFVY